MVKILGTICVILAVSVYILFSMYRHSQKEINALESEKNRLTNIVKGYQNAEVEANITIKELREQLVDKNNLDWYNDTIPSSLLDRVRKRHNRNRKG